MFRIICPIITIFYTIHVIRRFIICIAFVWHDSLTSTKDVSYVIGIILINCHSIMVHLHIVKTNFGIALDGDIAISACVAVIIEQCYRQSVFNFVLAH